MLKDFHKTQNKKLIFIAYLTNLSSCIKAKPFMSKKIDNIAFTKIQDLKYWARMRSVNKATFELFKKLTYYSFTCLNYKNLAKKLHSIEKKKKKYVTFKDHILNLKISSCLIWVWAFILIVHPAFISFESQYNMKWWIHTFENENSTVWQKNINIYHKTSAFFGTV